MYFQFYFLKRVVCDTIYQKIKIKGLIVQDLFYKLYLRYIHSRILGYLIDVLIVRGQDYTFVQAEERLRNEKGQVPMDYKRPYESLQHIHLVVTFKQGRVSRWRSRLPCCHGRTKSRRAQLCRGPPQESGDDVPGTQRSAKKLWRNSKISRRNSVFD